MGNSRRKENVICFLDTEFNARDYAGQNGDVQEITEIGAAVYRDGKRISKFQRYCILVPGHHLTKRSTAVTGITWETLEKKGIPFRRALEEFFGFLDRYRPSVVYAFGTADRLEMENTAKLNKVGKDLFRRLGVIKNIQPVFSKGLRLTETYSLEEICSICTVDHGRRAHSAVCDAEDTAAAYFNMKEGKTDAECLERLKAKKQAFAKKRAVSSQSKKEEKKC